MRIQSYTQSNNVNRTCSGGDKFTTLKDPKDERPTS